MARVPDARSFRRSGRSPPARCGRRAYFPDEYIYTALSRSIAPAADPLVRGEPAHFPALLEPLLAAPLWLVGSIATGYRLVQCENALFMSLAAIPVYLLARRLGLGSRYALASAAFALALPELVFSALLLSDPLAYPLVLGALYAGVVALQAPSRRAQLAFVGLAGLATFARAEYVVLAVAFVVAAILLDGRAASRLQRLPLVLFGGVAIVVAALGPSRVLGFYSAVDGSTSTAAPALGRRSTFSSSLSPAASQSFPARCVGLPGRRPRRARVRALVVPLPWP